MTTDVLPPTRSLRAIVAALAILVGLLIVLTDPPGGFWVVVSGLALLAPLVLVVAVLVRGE